MLPPVSLQQHVVLIGEEWASTLIGLPMLVPNSWWKGYKRDNNPLNASTTIGVDFDLGCIFLFSGIYFVDQKTCSCQDSWGFLFFLVFSGGIFHRNMVFEGVAGIPDFCRCHRNFLQEFLWDRNSCIYPRFLQIPMDSARFLFPPNAVLLWPATKVGFLLSKHQLK